MSNRVRNVVKSHQYNYQTFLACVSSGSSHGVMGQDQLSIIVRSGTYQVTGDLFYQKFKCKSVTNHYKLRSHSVIFSQLYLRIRMLDVCI